MKQASDLLRRATPAGAGQPEPGRDHECDDGWIYTDDGVKRCAVCSAAAAYLALREKLVTSGIGTLYAETTWDDLQLVPPLDVLSKVDINEVVSLGHHAVLSGPPGSGKTQSAVLIAKAAIEAGMTALVANLGRLCVEIRGAYRADNGPTEASVVRDLSKADVLVLDDVGAGEADTRVLENRIMYLALEARQNGRRPTIVTTNLTPQQLAEHVGSRVMNRLAPFETFLFKHGRNFRGAKKATAWRPK